MKLNCNLVKDILPLVVEGLASEDTVKLINSHIESCPQCKEEYLELKTSKSNYKTINKIETIPLKKVSRRLKNQNIYIGLLSALLICLLLVVLVNMATKPIPLSYTEAVESSRAENNQIFIVFKPEVSNYSIESYGSNHDIMAWKTNISKFFNKGEPKNTVINIDNKQSTTVHYINQSKELDKILYGKVNYEGRITLPRLVMNYYLLIMIFVFIIGIFLYLIFKKVVKIRRVLKPLIIFALSYILGSLFSSSGITYHIIRDFSFVIVTSILFFAIFVLIIYKESFLSRKTDFSK